MNANAAEKPDASLFQKNEKPREYEVRFRVDGEVYLTIMADSPEDARAKANDKLDDEEFGLELDDISDIRVSSVRKSSPMFLVLRNGKAMQTSYLQVGDEPREPDERGF